MVNRLIRRTHIVIPLIICFLANGWVEVTPTVFSLNGTSNQNLSGIYCPVMDDGQNITCVIDHGEQTGTMWLEQSYDSPICTTHQYNTGGLYQVTAYCITESKIFNDTVSIYIGETITGVTIGEYNTSFIATSVNTNARILITFTTGTDVTINATDYVTGENVLLVGNVSSIDVTYVDVLKSTIGQYVYEITLTNLISSVTRYAVIAVEESIAGFSLLSPSTYVVLIYETFELQFALTSGSNVVVSFSLANTSYIDKCSGQLRSYNSTFTLNETGIYDAVLEISNFVYVYPVLTKIISFNVQYRVHNITVTPAKRTIMKSETEYFVIEMASDALVPMGNLSATIDYGDGINGIQEILLDTLSPGTTFNTPDVSYAPGVYNVHVSVHSEITSLNFTWTEVVENPVQSLEFLYSADVALADGPQQIGVRITDSNVSPLTNLRCVFTIGGVQVEQVFNLTYGTDGNITHQYASDGNITIEYNCSSSLSWQADVGYVRSYTDCFSNAILFDPIYKDKSKALRLYTTNVNTIIGKVQVEANCQNSTRDYWWNLKKVYPNNTEIPRKYYTFEENQPKSIVISFAKESTERGLYSLYLTVNLTQIPGGYINDYLYVIFEYPPIVTGIVGGYERVISFNADLNLNAVSQTEDIVTILSDVFHYDWTCKKTNLPSQNISDIIRRFNNDELNVLDSVGTNCDVSAVPPQDVGVKTISSTNLDTDNWYIYVVNVTKGERSAAGIQAVYVSPGLSPNIGIKCTRNCLSKVTQRTRIALEVLCSECQNNAATVYQWTIQKYSDIDSEYQTLSDVTSVMESADDSNVLGIKANSLEEGASYRFQLDVNPGPPYRSVSISYLVNANLPPYGGRCSINPLEGYAAFTVFRITCEDWLDEADRIQREAVLDVNQYITYKVIQRINGTFANETTEFVIVNSQESLIACRFNVGHAENDYETDVIVRVADSYYDYTDVNLKVKVRNPLDNSTWTTDEKISAITSFVNDIITEAELTNDAAIVIQTASTIASLLNIQAVVNVTVYEVEDQPSDWFKGLLDVSENGTQETYSNLMDNLLNKKTDKIQDTVKEAMQNLTGRMISQLQSGNTSTYSMVEMSSLAFSGLISNNDFSSSETALDTATALQMLAGSYTNLTDDVLGSRILSATPEIETTANSLFSLQSNLINTTIPHNLNTSFFAVSSTDMAVARTVVDFEAYLVGHEAHALEQSAEITPEERNAVYRLKARIVEYELEVKHEVAKETSRALVDSTQSITQSLLRTTCKTCEDTIRKQNIDVVLSKTDIVKLKEKNITSGNTNLKLNLGSNGGNTVGQLSFVSFKRSPYIYGADLGDATSITSDVNKVSITDENNNELSIDKIILTKPTGVISSGYYEPTFTDGDASKMFYHVFYYRRLQDSVCLNIIPSLPVRVSQYEVFIRQENYPTHLTYSSKSYVAPERDWTVCISPEYLTIVGKTYIGLRPTPITSPTSRRKLLDTGINVTEASLSTYNFTIVTSSCQSWDENQGLWDGRSCQMDWFPAKGETECKCEPTKDMTFADTFFVAPNTIDFSSVFLKFSPLNQAAVLASLCIIFVCYIILIIWARHQDKKDQVKWGVTPLVDNFVDDSYYYLITVYTGMRRGAGTRSRIGFIVSGSEGDTGIRELYDGVRKEISTGSVMYFVMAVSEPLGDLDYVYIWHDNSGTGNQASWYLNRIDIEDIQAKERTVFLCGKWLAVDNGEGTLDAVLPACGKENLTTFENMFFINAKDNLSNSHMWVSIFYRPTSSVYTRVQRVSCAFVFILLTMIANAMYFTPKDEFDNPNLIRVGSLVFSWQEIYVSIVSALISATGTLLVILLFKKSKPRRINHDVTSSSSKYKVPVIGNWMDSLLKDSKELEQTLVAKGVTDLDEAILPFWCVYIAWILVVAGTIVPAFFIMLYSMQWGKQKSEMWLSRFFLSFFESSFLLDPLKVVLMAVMFAIIFKQKEKFKPLGLDRKTILKNYRQRFGRQQPGFRFPSPPLSPESLEKARENRRRDMKMLGSLKEVGVTVIFLWIVFSISYSNRDDRSYLLHRNIVNRIMDPVEKTSQKFSKITNAELFVKWLNWTAFPVLFPETEYNSDPLHWRWRQYFSDLSNYRVGPPRLRQLRVGKGETVIPKFGKVTVYPNYDILKESSEDLCYAWVNPPCDKEKEAHSFSNGAWSFTSAKEIWGVPTMGLYTTYGGGGYIAELDVNWSFSNRTLKELCEGFWFDRQTRAVFLEFVVYSPSLNIFTYNFFAAEFPDTGGVITLYSIYPIRIYQHHGTQGTYVIFCEVSFVLFLVLLSIRVIWRFVQFRIRYFRDAWRTLDFICIIFGLVGIAIYVGRLILANDTMANFKKDPKAFVNFQHIAFWDLMFVVLLGSLVFLAILRLLGILGYDKRIGEVFRVFNNCAWDLFWFGVIFFYLFVTYALLGYLFFGRDLNSYSDVIESLSTLFISMIGKSRFSEIDQSEPIMSKFYFLTFVIFLVYFMLTMFLAILCDSINLVHQWTKKDRSDELIDYLIEKFKQLTSKKNSKQSGDKDLEFSSIIESRSAYVALLNDLRDSIYTAISDMPIEKTGAPLPPKSSKNK